MSIDWKNLAGTGFVERDQEQKLIALALLTREHVVLFGDPGTGKSALANGLVKALGGNFFNLLFTRFTTPEEVFGPLSLAALEQDRFERQTGGYLPEASVAFLDEIFKANSAILNTLLAILNERTYFERGVARTIPLDIVIAASNEFPDPDGGLDALDDRFLFRRWVSPIKDAKSFAAYFMGCNLPEPKGISPLELSQARQEVKAVVLKPAVANWIVQLKNSLAVKNIVVSDRRWLKCRKVLQASAYMGGRKEVVADDLMSLIPALWRRQKDAAEVEQIVTKLVGTLRVATDPNLAGFAAAAATVATSPGAQAFRPKANVTDPTSIARAKNDPGMRENAITFINERISLIMKAQGLSDSERAALVTEWEQLAHMYVS
jgi:MoxR-like ATPase